MNVEQIMSTLTSDEKIKLLSGKNVWQTVDYPDKGIPSIFMADGPCGLRKQDVGGDHLGIIDSVSATALVSGGCLAATWSRECAEKQGSILGEEAAAENVDVLLAPAMNIVRSPLCGRNFEYFSEDPYLTGEIACGYTHGVQATGVGACAKHYAANNQETEREFINAIIDERTMREIYLPAFEKVIKQEKPQAIMSALNQINGEYGAEHKKLLTDILRNEWGFDGYTVSDWFGIVHYDLAVKAGMDLEMPYSEGVGAEKLKKALISENITEKDIDRCCLHILNAVKSCTERKKARKPAVKSEMLKRHHILSREIATEGIVMLKNEDNILPLKKSEKVAIIGLYAKDPRITLDGSARVIKTDLDVPIDFISKLCKGNCEWAQGYTDSDCANADDKLENEAIALAGRSDKVVFFMGQPEGMESEGHDRKNLYLPKNQEHLLEKLYEANNSIVVVLLNASAVVMPWVGKVKGIFECFLAGQGFGSAVADLLYGVKSPSGKLPVSFTKNLEDTSAYLNFPGNSVDVRYNEGVFVGYRYYDLKHTDLLFPFGFGLSYTTFQYYGLEIEKEIFGADDVEISLSLTIENTGDVAGAEVAELYIGGFDYISKRPLKELKGFEKVFLRPKEKKEIRFTLTKRDFAFYCEEYGDWYVPKGKYKIMVGASSKDIRLKKDIEVFPEKQHLPLLTGWSKIGDLRATPKGEEVYRAIKKRLLSDMSNDTVFCKKSEVTDDNKVEAMALRFINLITNGRIDNDELLSWIAEVNKER